MYRRYSRSPEWQVFVKGRHIIHICLIIRIFLFCKVLTKIVLRNIACKGQRSVANVAIFKLNIFQRTCVNFALNSKTSQNFVWGFQKWQSPFMDLSFGLTVSLSERGTKSSEMLQMFWGTVLFALLLAKSVFAVPKSYIFLSKELWKIKVSLTHLLGRLKPSEILCLHHTTGSIVRGYRRLSKCPSLN